MPEVKEPPAEPEYIERWVNYYDDDSLGPLCQTRDEALASHLAGWVDTVPVRLPRLTRKEEQSGTAPNPWPAATEAEPTSAPVAPPQEPQYSYEKIYGEDDYRVRDGQDNRIATCWVEENAKLIVAALNGQPPGTIAPAVEKPAPARQRVREIKESEANAIADSLAQQDRFFRQFASQIASMLTGLVIEADLAE